MPRGIREIAGSVLALLVLVVVLVSIDARIATDLRRFFRDVRDLTWWTSQPKAWGDALVSAFAHQGIDSLLLIAFSVVAVVLVLLMLRT
jgi:hypothetical protein